MKILQFHNEYVFPGGEDAVAASEAAMLRSFGHDVVEYRRSNKELSALGALAKLRFYLQDVYFSCTVYDQVRALIAKEKPDIAHFHNSFFMAGPAAYEACFDAGVPVVQSLHNYRFLCAAATFYRHGRVCEECLSGGRGRGIVHGCWHGSRLFTWLITRVIREYEKRRILSRITKFLVTSDFSRRKFLEAGWAAVRIVVKPNFLETDPLQQGAGSRPASIRDVGEVSPGQRLGGEQGKGEAGQTSANFTPLHAPCSLPNAHRHVLYVGALQSYKGVATLLRAWSSRTWPVPLKIVGSGPMDRELRSLNVGGVEWLGQRSQAEVVALMKGSLCVVLPSECYENFPRVIIEAYACGVPVVASRMGAMPELVQEGRTGLLFEPGGSGALASALGRLVLEPDLAAGMGRFARRLFEERYTSKPNHEQLLALYQQLA